jgi:hypothetical protein
MRHAQLKQTECRIQLPKPNHKVGKTKLPHTCQLHSAAAISISDFDVARLLFKLLQRQITYETIL